jgi:flagellar hook assembly protein FlgD
MTRDFFMTIADDTPSPVTITASMGLKAATAAGVHSVVWQGRDADGRAVPSGAYVVRLAADSVAQSRKVQLLR